MRNNSLLLGINTPVKNLYGVGEKRAEALARMGIFTALDLVSHFPRGYEMRGNVRTVKEACDGEVCSLVLTVAAPPKNAMIRRSMTITKVLGCDETGRCTVTFFNQPYVRDMLKTGTEARFYGKIERRGNTVSMSSPAVEVVREGVPLRPFVPVYPLTVGISQKLMASYVRSALDVVFDPASADCLRETLSYEMRKQHGLCDLKYALYSIHCPADYEALERAKKRLAFEEIYLFALMLSMAGKSEKSCS